jgi:hypothetical protein
MKRSNLLLTCLALAVVSMITFVAPAAAGDEVPLKGNLQGDVVHTAVSPTVDSVVITATGNVGPLGHAAITTTHLVDRVARQAVGTYDFTAANGDTVHAEFTGRAMPTATPGVLAIVEIATITGGTGRFEGATGSFTIQRLYDQVAGTTDGTIEGSISSPGSNYQ